MIGSVYDKNIYISGPMSGHDDFNYDAFSEVELLLKGAQAGTVYNPAKRHCIKEGLFVRPRIEWMVWLDYMGDDLNMLSKTERRPLKDGVNVPLFDYLVSLPGWEDSKGATIERMLADAAGIECFDWEEIEAEVRKQHDYQQREDY
jgi:hypothetical protein